MSNTTAWDTTDRPIPADAVELLIGTSVKPEELTGATVHHEYISGGDIVACLRCGKPIPVGTAAEVYEDAQHDFLAAAHFTEDERDSGESEGEGQAVFRALQRGIDNYYGRS